MWLKSQKKPLNAHVEDLDSNYNFIVSAEK